GSPLHEGLLLLVPGLAAVLGVHDLAELADDPTLLGIDEFDVVEDGIGGREALAARQVRFHVDLPRAPRLSAVGGRGEHGAVADGPRMLRVERVQTEEEERLADVLLDVDRVGLLLLPGLPAVGRVQDETILGTSYGE